LNDTSDDVKRLVKLSRRTPSKINLIPYHNIDRSERELRDLGLQSATPETVEAFAKALRNHNVTVMLRSSSGKTLPPPADNLLQG